MVTSILNSMWRPYDTVGKFIVPNQSRNLPPAEVDKHRQAAEQMRVSLNGEIIRPKTEDNIELDAFYFLGLDPATKQHVPKSAATVVLFCGMGCYHYFFYDLVQKYRHRGCNVVIFNYRGIGDSGGTADCQGMVKDGLGIVDYLHRHHSVPLDSIVVHGHSLGGGPSSSTAVARPGVSVVNDRSYARLSSAAPSFIKIALQHVPIIGSMGAISPVIMRSLGWDFNTQENWKNIKGRKCVVYHRDDEVISKETSLYQAILGKDPSTTFVELDKGVPGSPHGRALTDNEADTLVNAVVPRVHQVAVNIIQQAVPVVPPQPLPQPPAPGTTQPPAPVTPAPAILSAPLITPPTPLAQLPVAPTVTRSELVPPPPQPQPAKGIQKTASKTLIGRVGQMLFDFFAVIFFPLGIYVIVRDIMRQKQRLVSQTTTPATAQMPKVS